MAYEHRTVLHDDNSKADPFELCFFFLALDLYHGMFFHVANKTLTVLVTS